AALHVLLPDRVGDLTGVGGGVLGTLAAGAGVTVVDHVMPLLPQVGDHHALEVAAGLVAANTDTHTAMIRNLRTATAHASCHVVHSPLAGGGRDVLAPVETGRSPPGGGEEFAGGRCRRRVGTGESVGGLA